MLRKHRKHYQREKAFLPMKGITNQNCRKLLLNNAAAAAKSLQSCPTLQPHRWKPTRLPRPWGSPGKNTGVGCHFLLQCMKVKSESEVTQSCLTLRNPMDRSLPGSSVHGIFQARVLAGVGCHCLLRCSTIILAKNNKVMFCKCRRKITYNFIPSYTMSDYKTFPGRQRLRIYYPQMLHTHTHTYFSKLDCNKMDSKSKKKKNSMR